LKSIKEVDYDLRKTKSDLALYDQNKCPECGSDLTTDDHAHSKNLLSLKYEESIKIKKELDSGLNDLQEKKKKLDQLNRDAQRTWTELKIYLNNLKRRMEELKSDIDSQDFTSINEFIKTIEDLEIKRKLSEQKAEELSGDLEMYKRIEDVFSEKGIKKTIIANIVRPINHFIKDNLSFLNMHFEVELDDEFQARIIYLNEEIEADSLSTGEMKKVNICIMLAYLKLIRMKRYINLLFLDEVFSSIDVEGIYSILAMLKEFAKDSKINIFLVHHSQLSYELFDRVLSIEKNITSEITEVVKMENI
jgi:DNA repair exonuclease SbcCD ATPase subunit